MGLPKMSNSIVDKLRVEGEIAVWSYGDQKNYEGWHISCDDLGANFLLDLIDAMLVAQYPSKKIINLSTNRQLAMAPGVSRKPRFAKSLALIFSRENNSQYWEFVTVDKNIFLSLGVETITTLRKGIEDIKKGNGDYSIGNNPCLWFWWKVNV